MLKKLVLSVASLILIFSLFSCDGNIKNIEFSFSSALESEFPQSTFNINVFKFIDQSFSTAGSVIDLRGLFISPDGVTFYVLDRVGQKILQYDLKSAFLVESAVYKEYFSFANLIGTGCQTESAAHGIYFRGDGGRVFVFNRNEIWQYDLTEPWAVGTAFLRGYNCLDNIVTRGHGIDFSPNGSLFYVDDRAKAKIYSFTLGEPWDISSLEYLAEYKILRYSEVRGIRITEGGKSVFILDTDLMEIQQHDFSVPSDLYTLKCFSHTSVFGQSINPRGIAFSSHGPYVYISDAGTGIIYQYDFKN
jgi:DNA-binding beta-propeller fold protein YncE